MRSQQRITLDQIAAAAGVSRPTVSKVLGPDAGRYRIPEKTRERVQAVASSLGYVSDRVNRATALPRHRPLIGLVTAERLPWSLSCYGDLAGDIAAELGLHGMDLMVVIDQDGWHQWEREQRDSQLAGAILLEFLSSELDVFLSRVRIPCVLVNWPSELPVDQVVPDEGEALRLACNHLLDLGHRHVVYLVPEVARHSGSLHERERILRSMFGSMDGRVEVVAGVTGALLKLASDPSITAVVTYHEQEVPDLVAELYARGRRIPQDLSVLSCSKAPALSWVHPGITSLEAPWGEIARAAARQLVERIGGLTAPPRREQFPARLVIRGSTGPARPTAQEARPS